LVTFSLNLQKIIKIKGGEKGRKKGLTNSMRMNPEPEESGSAFDNHLKRRKHHEEESIFGFGTYFVTCFIDY